MKREGKFYYELPLPKVIQANSAENPSADIFAAACYSHKSPPRLFSLLKI